MSRRAHTFCSHQACLRCLIFRILLQSYCRRLILQESSQYHEEPNIAIQGCSCIFLHIFPCDTRINQQSRECFVLIWASFDCDYYYGTDQVYCPGSFFLDALIVNAHYPMCPNLQECKDGCFFFSHYQLIESRYNQMLLARP
jgi:hypothetical protein